MSTYRAYFLNTDQALSPTVTVAYVRGEKYGDAWKNGRAGKETFTDAEATKAYKPSETTTLVKVIDMTVRNAKLDKKALQAIVADPKASDADKLKALTALIA